jgi:hypothetical protein
MLGTASVIQRAVRLFSRAYAVTRVPAGNPVRASKADTNGSTKSTRSLKLALSILIAERLIGIDTQRWVIRDWMIQDVRRVNP